MRSQKNIRTIFLLLSCILYFSCNTHGDGEAIPAPGYVSVNSKGFAIDSVPWYPIMLNYKAFLQTVDGRIEAVPAEWYRQGDMQSHFDTIRSWGFNAVRICLDADEPKKDTAAMFAATRRMVQRADSAGLHVMLLIKAPFKGYWRDYAAGLMRRLADLPALWAYDLMNEPLYFDTTPDRDKWDAVREVYEWRQLVRRNAPHQLFTIATAEPIEVFEWDPSMLPVDFIEMHTYHPLRVQSEMWWYSHYCGKPWMVGETGLPADNDSVPYTAQAQFMEQTYRYARAMGAIGYGWWELQDHPNGVNFEAQYTGLRDIQGCAKPAAQIVKRLSSMHADEDTIHHPVNYNNMLAYENIATVGRIINSQGEPIEGAVVRGWNKDWSIGMNTYTDIHGRFCLVSNDVCTHFEVSAPGLSRQKFDYEPAIPSELPLPNQALEYQQLPLLGWGDSGSILPVQVERFAHEPNNKVQLGDIILKKL